MIRRASILAVTVIVSLTFAGCIASIGNRSAPSKKTADVQPHQVQGSYRIETVELENGQWALLKYRADTGEAWYSKAPDNRVWIPILDADPVPSSAYVFRPEATGGWDWSVIRLDFRNGRTWITRDSVWVEVEEPSEDS